MEDRTFDTLTRVVSETWTSRRSVLGRLGLGGLAALGLGTFGSVEEADAKKCKKKCKDKNSSRKRRKCRKKCDKKTTPTPAAGFPITVNTTLLGTPCTVLGGECGTGTGLECVGLVCVPIDLDDACVTGADCDTGNCNAGVCAECDVANVCGVAGSQQCCVADAACVADLCVLPAG